MDTTGADANDEFARWLAETAKAGQAAEQATPVQPTAPAAPPPSVPPAQPAQPNGAPPSPEFFGADQLAAPPTRPYEASFAGPQVARTSFQPAAGDPPIPPTPPAPPAQPVPPAPAAAPPTPAPSAGPHPPVSPPPAPPAAAPPSWAPGYAAPSAAATAPPAAPTTPQQAEGTPFFPLPGAAPDGLPPAPPASAPPAFPSIEIPPAPAQPTAPVPPPAPAPPAAPAYEAPVAQQAPAPQAPSAPPEPDPFGALFEAGQDDTAARLAASPPPGSGSPTPLVQPVEEEPLSGDPLSALFGGLQTSEAPVVHASDPFASTPVEPTPPAYVPEPAFTVEPVLPAAPLLEQAVPASAIPATPAPTTPTPDTGYAQAFSSTPPSDDDPTAGTQFFGGGTGEYEDPPDLERSTIGEKVVFALAFLLPPVGLIGSIVAASQSARRRGWVHGLLRAALVISVLTTIAAGVAGAYGYKQLEDQQRHDAIAASSAQFCSTIAEQPDMIEPPTFGFPGPGPSIPETIEGIQVFVDRWDALAAVSPSGIRQDVTRIADAARDILGTIEKSRLVNNEQNIANMTTVAESTGIVAWEAEYC